MKNTLKIIMEVHNQDLGVDDSWFNELHTQFQSLSSFEFGVEKHEHAPLHANMLDKEEKYHCLIK
jgi:hypothetical protein